MSNSASRPRSHVQPVVMLDGNVRDRTVETLVGLQRTFDRKPLVISRERKWVRHSALAGAIVLVTPTGVLASLLLASLYLRASRTDRTLVVVGPNDDGSSAESWVGLSRAARSSGGMVAAAAPVDWSTRGMVLEPKGGRDALRTRALGPISWIADDRDLDRHLELATNLAPTGAVAVSARVFRERALATERGLVRTCMTALDGAVRRRHITTVECPNPDARGIEAAIDLMAPKLVRVYPIGRLARPARRTLAGAAERTNRFQAPPSAEHRAGLGILWKMPVTASRTPARARDDMAKVPVDAAARPSQ